MTLCQECSNAWQTVILFWLFVFKWNLCNHEAVLLQIVDCWLKTKLFHIETLLQDARYLTKQVLFSGWKSECSYSWGKFWAWFFVLVKGDCVFQMLISLLLSLSLLLLSFLFFKRNRFLKSNLKIKWIDYLHLLKEKLM